MCEWKVQAIPTVHGKRYIVCRYEGEPPKVHRIQLSAIYSDGEKAQAYADKFNRKENCYD